MQAEKIYNTPLYIETQINLLKISPCDMNRNFIDSFIYDDFYYGGICPVCWSLFLTTEMQTNTYSMNGYRHRFPTGIVTKKCNNCGHSLDPIEREK